MDKLKAILKEAFKAGEYHNSEKGFCEPDEDFEEWYENHQQQVKKLNIDDVSISLECEDCGGSIDDEDVFCKHCGDEIPN